MKSQILKIAFICLFINMLLVNNTIIGQEYNIFQHQIDSILKKQQSNQDDSSRIVDMSHLASYYFFQYDYVKGFETLDKLSKASYTKIPLLKDIYYYLSLQNCFGPYHTHLREYYFIKIRELVRDAGQPKDIDIDVSKLPQLSESTLRRQLFAVLNSPVVSVDFFKKGIINAHLLYSYARADNVDSLSYYGEIAFNAFDKSGKKGEALHVLGSKMLEYNYHRLRDSLREHELRAINYISTTDDKTTRAEMYEGLSWIYDNLRRHSSTIQCYMKANELWEELDDKKRQVIMLSGIGKYLGLIKNFDNQRDYCLRALNLKKRTNDTINLYTLYTALTFNAVALKQIDEAEKYVLLAKASLKDTNNLFDFASVLDAQGQTLMLKGKYADAIQIFSQCVEKFKVAGNNVYLSYPNLYIGRCYDSLNEIDKGIQYAQLSYDQSKSQNWLDNIMNSSLLLADLYDKKGEKSKAFQYLSIYVEAKKEYDDKNESAKAADFEAQDIINRNQKRIELLQKDNELIVSRNRTQKLGIVSAVLALLGAGYFIFFLNKSNKHRQKANRLLERQRNEIHGQKETLETALTDLKATQNQLIQKEKLASLGELTAGIAHEIQNPLNFVNNFSELSVDLVKDLKDEIEKPNIDKVYVGELFTDLSQNQDKINHHGKRASSIVKGMLEHSRASTGVKELTDINKLADEYLRLSYHGLRAKDKDFNADYELIIDDNLPKIEVIPQDIGRVLLNLINNAFYAVKAPQPPKGESYVPTVTVSTHYQAPPLGAGGAIIIKVKDNGTGMPESVRDKVFQPFFTTKPTGQGTGLGLSLAYDIVTKGHGGTLEMESAEGVGSEFIIQLPLRNH